MHEGDAQNNNKNKTPNTDTHTYTHTIQKIGTIIDSTWPPQTLWKEDCSFDDISHNLQASQYAHSEYKHIFIKRNTKEYQIAREKFLHKLKIFIDSSEKVNHESDSDLENENNNNNNHLNANTVTNIDLYFKIPQLFGINVDLFHLYLLITKRGGFDHCNKLKLWNDIIEETEFYNAQYIKVIEYKLSQIYTKYLLDYEAIFFDCQTAIEQEIPSNANQTGRDATCTSNTSVYMEDDCDIVNILAKYPLLCGIQRLKYRKSANRVFHSNRNRSRSKSNSNNNNNDNSNGNSHSNSNSNSNSSNSSHKRMRKLTLNKDPHGTFYDKNYWVETYPSGNQLMSYDRLSGVGITVSNFNNNLMQHTKFTQLSKLCKYDIPVNRFGVSSTIDGEKFVDKIVFNEYSTTVCRSKMQLINPVRMISKKELFNSKLHFINHNLGICYLKGIHPYSRKMIVHELTKYDSNTTLKSMKRKYGDLEKKHCKQQDIKQENGKNTYENINGGRNNNNSSCSGSSNLNDNENKNKNKNKNKNSKEIDMKESGNLKEEIKFKKNKLSKKSGNDSKSSQSKSKQKTSAKKEGLKLLDYEIDYIIEEIIIKFIHLNGMSHRNASMLSAMADGIQLIENEATARVLYKSTHIIYFERLLAPMQLLFDHACKLPYNFMAHSKGFGVVCIGSLKNRDNQIEIPEMKMKNDDSNSNSNSLLLFNKDDFISEVEGEIYPSWRYVEKTFCYDKLIHKLQNGKLMLKHRPFIVENNENHNLLYLIDNNQCGQYSNEGCAFNSSLNGVNWVSRLNHSCDNNCELRLFMTPVNDGQETTNSVLNFKNELNYNDNDKNCKYRYALGLFALRSINKGDELTINYQWYSGDVETCKEAICLCGSVNCKGTFIQHKNLQFENHLLNRSHSFVSRLVFLLYAGNETLNRTEMNILETCFHENTRTIEFLKPFGDWCLKYVSFIAQYILYEKETLPGYCNAASNTIGIINRETTGRGHRDANNTELDSEVPLLNDQDCNFITSRRFRALSICIDRIKWFLSQQAELFNKKMNQYNLNYHNARARITNANTSMSDIMSQFIASLESGLSSSDCGGTSSNSNSNSSSNSSSSSSGNSNSNERGDSDVNMTQTKIKTRTKASAKTDGSDKDESDSESESERQLPTSKQFVHSDRDTVVTRSSRGSRSTRSTRSRRSIGSNSKTGNVGRSKSNNNENNNSNSNSREKSLSKSSRQSGNRSGNRSGRHTRKRKSTSIGNTREQDKDANYHGDDDASESDADEHEGMSNSDGVIDVSDDDDDEDVLFSSMMNHGYIPNSIYERGGRNGALNVFKQAPLVFCEIDEIIGRLWNDNDSLIQRLLKSIKQCQTVNSKIYKILFKKYCELGIVNERNENSLNKIRVKLIEIAMILSNLKINHKTRIDRHLAAADIIYLYANTYRFFKVNPSYIEFVSPYAEVGITNSYKNVDKFWNESMNRKNSNRRMTRSAIKKECDKYDTGSTHRNKDDGSHNINSHSNNTGGNNSNISGKDNNGNNNGSGGSGSSSRGDYGFDGLHGNNNNNNNNNNGGSGTQASHMCHYFYETNFVWITLLGWHHHCSLDSSSIDGSLINKLIYDEYYKNMLGNVLLPDIESCYDKDCKGLYMRHSHRRFILNCIKKQKGWTNIEHTKQYETNEDMTTCPTPQFTFQCKLGIYGSPVFDHFLGIENLDNVLHGLENDYQM